MANTENTISNTISLSRSVVDDTIMLDLSNIGGDTSVTALSDYINDITVDWSKSGVTGMASDVIWGTDTINTINTTTSNRLNLAGQGADVVINGISLADTLRDIQQRLNILTPNPEMESEWDELRELGERYRKLEQQCMEKSRMWSRLKDMPPPEIK